MMDKIYMDNGSTSFPKAPGVGDAMRDFIENVGVNIALAEAAPVAADMSARGPLHAAAGRDKRQGGLRVEDGDLRAPD